MVLWGLSLLVISLSFIAYKHGHVLAAKLPQILRHVEAHPNEREGSDKVAQKEEKRDATCEGQTNASTKSTSPPPTSTKPSVEVESPNSTPKAHGIQLQDQVPSLSLNESSSELNKVFKPNDGTILDATSVSLSTRALPTPNPLPNQAMPRASQLMPPPSIPLPRRMTPTATQAARIPTTGPLPNRGPSAPRPANSLTVPGVPMTPTMNSRNKVALAPGRSSIDWAQLTKTNRNLSGVQYLQRLTPSQLKQMNGRKGRPVWASYQGRVYNLTPYVPYHPGGEGEIMRAAGKDAEKLFNEIHAYVNWENMLGQCCVGIMVTENEKESRAKNDWEAMD